MARPIARAGAAFAVNVILAPPLGAGELRTPDPSYGPKEVVRMQLDALQSNDDPTANHGIKQTRAFAHPANKRMTGPLSAFTEMIESPRYAILLNHKRHTVKKVARGADRAVYTVRVVGARGSVVAYRWRVARVADGKNAGAWMTTAVSAPMDAGDAI